MYISKTDVEKGIYTELLQVLTRTPEVIDTAISEAIGEVSAYLSARYNITDELQKNGTNRNVVVVKCVRDVAIWNCYKASNPVNMSEAREAAYKQTIDFLKLVQGERANIIGLERLHDSQGGSNYVKFGGNTKRNNHY
jgi:phage gp36-like protein